MFDHCYTQTKPCVLHGIQTILTIFSLPCPQQDSDPLYLDYSLSIWPLCCLGITLCGTWNSSYSCNFLSPAPRGRIRTLHLQIIARVFDHCASWAQPCAQFKLTEKAVPWYHRLITDIHSRRQFSTLMKQIPQTSLKALLLQTVLSMNCQILLPKATSLAFLITFVNTFLFNINCK